MHPCKVSMPSHDGSAVPKLDCSSKQLACVKAALQTFGQLSKDQLLLPHSSPETHQPKSDQSLQVDTYPTNLPEARQKAGH